VLERLPPRLRRLLSDFSFKSETDRQRGRGDAYRDAGAEDVSTGKPIVLLDGNQPGVGKTLLVLVIGVILDGSEPYLIHYSDDDEELSKRICATLRSNHQNIVPIDNAKSRAGAAISSPTIESNSMAPQISLRILGQSANYTRPNDLLWVLTMNNTRICADGVSRGLPIRFHYEGDPRERDFGGRDPVAYAKRSAAEDPCRTSTTDNFDNRSPWPKCWPSSVSKRLADAAISSAALASSPAAGPPHPGPSQSISPGKFTAASSVAPTETLWISGPPLAGCPFTPPPSISVRPPRLSRRGSHSPVSPRLPARPAALHLAPHRATTELAPIARESGPLSGRDQQRPLIFARQGSFLLSEPV